MTTNHRRHVGSVRPSHLMFTSGVGALVDLPNFSVLVRGLDDWNYNEVRGRDDWKTITEPRLLTAVQGIFGKNVKELLPAPWLDGMEQDPRGPAARVGVPTTPFPTWLRCTACNELAPVDSQIFGFENDKPRRPQEARFFHKQCGVKKSGKPPLAITARFMLSCTAGHLDDFPYTDFVHNGTACSTAKQPRLHMDDRGGNRGVNVEIKCVNCSRRRNMGQAMGQRGEENLPRCRGRHPHLGTFEHQGCKCKPKVLVVGASNQWFAQNLSVLAVPRTEASELENKVEQQWNAVSTLPVAMYPYARENVPAFHELTSWTDAEIAEAVERVRARKEGESQQESEHDYPDLRTPEWEAFSAAQLPDRTEDFTLHRCGVPTELDGYYADVVQAERLREVRALIGFTRLDAPDPEDPGLVTRAPLARSMPPQWVPASEVRGEGVFLRVPEDLLREWENRVSGSQAMQHHRQAYAEFRKNRYSDRIPGDFDEMRHWPGVRYLALHTLSHLLIRTIALECGYSSANLSERIYAGTEDDPRSGILLYTAVPDAEGTLGGLVSQAEPDRLVRLTRRALADARRCSSDPLCAERLPQPPADFLHGAACHVCLFVSETTCERGNRFLDRRFVVPIDEHEDLALYREQP
ncbi:DrmB family protein [Actinopolyspora saharensis]|uniref:DrmB family protein n=1 Tax=Actinopolyspora saharensis TaxID=995062 RepID=UPI003F663A1A